MRKEGCLAYERDCFSATNFKNERTVKFWVTEKDS